MGIRNRSGSRRTSSCKTTLMSHRSLSSIWPSVASRSTYWRSCLVRRYVAVLDLAATRLATPNNQGPTEPQSLSEPAFLTRIKKVAWNAS
jgi:hypothetical protein